MDEKRFSLWTRWDARNQIEGIKCPGIYALAISFENLSGKQFSWIKEIAYFGMTNAISGLKGRLQQFHYTITGKTGHGGADRFLNDYPEYEPLVKKLYVATAPFNCNVTSNAPDALRVMGDVAKAEYECFAKFSEIFNELPAYNDKKKSPKFNKTRGSQ